MKRIFSFILTVILLLSLVACKGNLDPIDYKNHIAIPKNGIIKKDTFDEIKKGNAITVFEGESDNFKYEWTVFGKDLNDTRDINFLVGFDKTKSGIKVKFNETEDLGFSALLSIYITEKWNADSATAYNNGTAIYSVSITGIETTILNLSVNKIYSECEISPDDNKYEDNSTASNATTSENADANKQSTSNDTTKIDGSSSTQSNMGTTSSGEKDKYHTAPVPDGKPTPVEPEDNEVDIQKTYTCTFSIECTSILNNLSSLDSDKIELIPSNGIILEEIEVEFFDGESVFDVLQRVCQENEIHLESEWTPMYNSAYIEAIGNIYEKDCGELSGWQYRVNGWYPNYGCSRYKLSDGAKVEFRFSCDLGKDIGNDWMGQ